jgi:predicted methyltransferase
MKRRTILIRLAGLVLLAAVAYVVWQAGITLVRLEQVERDRDTWQRPGDIMTSLDLHGGGIVVDLGSGSGYFSIRLAPIVGPKGRVIAVDVLRQPLTFLWIRRLLRREWQIDIVRGQDDEPRLTVVPVDAVLVVNTYHELARPAATLEALRSALKPGGRLVVCDRRPRDGPGPSSQVERAGHTLSPATAEAEITAAGFTRLHRDDTFIDRPGDQPWWLMTFTRP